MHAIHFRLDFLPDFPKFELLFRKVVRQHTEGVVGNIKRLCSKFSTLSCGERVLKIRYELTKLSP